MFCSDDVFRDVERLMRGNSGLHRNCRGLVKEDGLHPHNFTKKHRGGVGIFAARRVW